MKPVHIPRSLIVAIIFLVVVTFLVGTMHAFASTRVSSAPTPSITAIAKTKNGTVLTPTAVPTPVQASADTTGIIALAIVIVIIVLIGTTLGGGRPHKKKFT